LLARARTLARSAGLPTATPDPFEAQSRGELVFVGSPVVAAELESLLAQLSMSGARASAQRAELDRLLLDVIDAERACRLDYEQRVVRLSPTPGGGGASAREVTVDTLQGYLQAHPRGAGAQVREVKEVPGGRSKRTVLVTLDPAGKLPSELVLRLDTGRGVGTSVTGEFPLLDRVAKLGQPVPEPLWLEASHEPFGFPFIVFRRMPGAAAGDLIEGAFRKEPATALALARVLGRIHAAGTQLVDEPARAQPAVAHTRELLTHYFDWWRSKKPFPSLVIETAFMWLLRNLDGGLGEPTVVHADTGFHNLLLDPSGNGCLLDWEFAHFGDPAEDLASCRPAVEKCMPWEGFMTEYQANGGKPVSDFRLRYFEIWRPLRNAAVCGTVMHSLMNGEADDIDPVTIALSTFMRLQADLARSLHAVLARTE
jgi:aminoglycoside phosphotransferase (APT) family kinase protein